MADFIVIGSANIDIICEAKEYKDTIDKPGSIHIDIGGAAANVALNLSKQGVSVDFITAKNNSAISSIIIKEIERPGINVLADSNDELPESCFSAHLKDGDLHSAIASMAVQYHNFKPTDRIIEAVKDADWMVLDCNLNIESLVMFMDLAKKYFCKVAILLVSEGKGLKITQLPDADIYFCNHREYIYLQTYSPDWRQSNKSTFIVTNGDKGAIVFQGLTKKCYPCNAFIFEGVISKNFMGAGDAYAAGVLYKLFYKENLDDAMENGANLAAQVISNQHCNLGQFNSLNKQIQNLNYHAYHDQLTNLYNRAGADLILSKLKKTNIGISVILFDIDHFKKFNDNHGHMIGDTVLVHISKLIKGSIGKSDYAFRFGGEEFVVIAQMNLRLAKSMAERIRKQIECFGAIGLVDKITVSIGIAYTNSANDFQNALNCADKALYKAKKNGRNRVCFAE